MPRNIFDQAFALRIVHDKALDMTEGQPGGHCIRCCYIGIHIGREIGLGEDELRDFPTEVRIVSTADVFDALTADRPYRSAMPIAKAIAILRDGAGQSHDPACIDALERALGRTSLQAAA